MEHELGRRRDRNVFWDVHYSGSFGLWGEMGIGVEGRGGEGYGGVNITIVWIIRRVMER